MDRVVMHWRAASAFLLVALLSALAPVHALAGDEKARAEERWNAGDRATSIELLAAHVSAHPADAPGRRLLVERQMSVHRYAQALEQMAALGDEARALRARAHFLLGHYEEALAALDTSDQGERILALHAMLRLGRMAEADELLGPDSSEPALQVLFGQRAARQRQFERAAAAFERALAQDPFDAEALFGRGQALVRMGRKAEGLALLERHRMLAPLLDELDFAQRGVDLAPLHAPSHANIGDVERKLGRTARARAAYTHALELASVAELAPIALRLARFLEEDLSDAAAALQVLEAAEAKHADVRLLVRMGDVAARAGQLERATQAYRAALEQRPQDRAIRARLAGLQAQREARD